MRYNIFSEPTIDAGIEMLRIIGTESKDSLGGRVTSFSEPIIDAGIWTLCVIWAVSSPSLGDRF
jgi:hypothetical protein